MKIVNTTDYYRDNHTLVSIAINQRIRIGEMAVQSIFCSSFSVTTRRRKSIDNDVRVCCNELRYTHIKQLSPAFIFQSIQMSPRLT